MKSKALKLFSMALTGALALSMAVTASAEEEKTLKVAMECSYAPYNWTQPDDSNGAVPISGSSDYAYGYDVMMAKQHRKRTGIQSGDRKAGLGFSGTCRSVRHR